MDNELFQTVVSTDSPCTRYIEARCLLQYVPDERSLCLHSILFSCPRRDANLNKNSQFRNKNISNVLDLRIFKKILTKALDDVKDLSVKSS